MTRGRLCAPYAFMNRDVDTARMNSYPHSRKLAAAEIAKAVRIVRFVKSIWLRTKPEVYLMGVSLDCCSPPRISFAHEVY